MKSQPKVILRRIGIGLVVAAVVGVIFVWRVGSALTAPAPAKVALPEEFNGSDVAFKSASGSDLKGNFIPGQKGRGVVILMHGVRTHRGAMARHAGFLRRHHFGVLLFDFQAHGESHGKKITSGFLESKDAAAAVEFVRKRAPDEKIAILGSSLGGAAAALAEPPLQVDGMILELVYSDIERAVKNRIAIVLGNWARPFSALLTLQLKWRLGIERDWLSPQGRIGSIRCPKLIIAGGKDRHTTRSDSEALFASAMEPKEFWVIEEAGHEDLYAVAGREYEDKIKSFLDRVLAGGSHPVNP